MTQAETHTTAIRTATAVYRMLLFAYPAAFRQKYGPHMLQVFRNECQSVGRRAPANAHPLAGHLALLVVWLRVLGDLATSALAERDTVVRQQAIVPQRVLYSGAALLAVLTGYVHLRTDADQLVILVLVGGAFCCGLAAPAGTWRWALIAGLGIPAALLLSHGDHALLFAHRDADTAMPLPVVPTLVAAYAGAVAHRSILRLGLVTPEELRP